MANISAHRPAVEWLTDLTKAKNENSGMKAKVTLQDLQERINDPNSEETSLIPSSPRSVQACFKLGIDPLELQYHPATWYRRPAEDEDISQLRYEKCEGVRQRKNLIDMGWTGTTGSKDPKKKKDDDEAHESSMVEKERQRLEALLRRQEKDLQQMVQFEISRKELTDKQAQKMAELEKRTQALVRQKLENEAAWQARQRDIELEKMREEEELELQLKRLMEERHRKEREMQIREAEEDKRRKKEAYEREMERRHKADEARRETEAILEEQAEQVRLRKADMERKDIERTKRREIESKRVAAENAEKRARADARIQSAMVANQQVLMKKRNALQKREEENEMRRKKLEDLRKRDEELKRQEDIRKEDERHGKFQQAQENEEMRKTSIRMKAEEKERALAELYLQRKKEMDIKKVNTEFELKLRHDKVDSIKKTHLYQRQQLLDKIMDEYESARKMMMERVKLQEKRKMANMSASLNRQLVASAMDNIRSKDINMLASGQMSVNDLLRRPGRIPLRWESLR
eukprot:gene17640-23981_t